MTTITLPADLEAQLIELARVRGVAPEVLAVETLRLLLRQESRGHVTTAGSLWESLQEYVGAIDGSAEALSENCGERFTAGLAQPSPGASPDAH